MERTHALALLALLVFAGCAKSTTGRGGVASTATSAATTPTPPTGNFEVLAFGPTRGPAATLPCRRRFPKRRVRLRTLRPRRGFRRLQRPRLFRKPRLVPHRRMHCLPFRAHNRGRSANNLPLGEVSGPACMTAGGPFCCATVGLTLRVRFSSRGAR